MNAFVYLIAEGVSDVALLTQVLCHGFGFSQIVRRSGLPGPAAKWFKDFRWPVGDDIARRAVPAPAILQRDGCLVGLRSAQGLDGFRATLRKDWGAFDRVESSLRVPWRPAAIGIIFDADDALPDARFPALAELLNEYGYPRPQQLEVVARSGDCGAGVFAFPGRGQPGSVEDVLLPLAAARFPGLGAYAGEYVRNWLTKESVQTAGDYEELRQPSGAKKATLSAAAALLKPGKPLVATLEDQAWLPDDLGACATLQPLLGFLRQLLATPA